MLTNSPDHTQVRSSYILTKMLGWKLCSSQAKSFDPKAPSLKKLSMDLQDSSFRYVSLELTQTGKLLHNPSPLGSHSPKQATSAQSFCIRKPSEILEHFSHLFQREKHNNGKGALTSNSWDEALVKSHWTFRSHSLECTIKSTCVGRRLTGPNSLVHHPGLHNIHRSGCHGCQNACRTACNHLCCETLWHELV